MGYRNYLYIVDKKKINKARKMSANALWELVGGKTELDEDIDTPWIGDVLDKLGAEEFIELGKYLDYTKKIDMPDFINLNMVFKGNAGTGKTTVARLYAELFFKLGFIKKNNIKRI